MTKLIASAIFATLALAGTAMAKPYVVDTAHGEKVVLEVQHSGDWCITSARFDRACHSREEWQQSGWNTGFMVRSMAFKMEEKGDLPPEDNPFR